MNDARPTGATMNHCGRNHIPPTFNADSNKIDIQSAMLSEGQAVA